MMKLPPLSKVPTPIYTYNTQEKIDRHKRIIKWSFGQKYFRNMDWDSQLAKKYSRKMDSLSGF
jgi:hypothetical protein